MKKKINYSPADFTMIDQLELLQSITRSDFKESVDLSLDQIRDTCASAWGIEIYELIGKINHSNNIDKARKMSFLYACYYFSNQRSFEIARYLGCYSGTVWRSQHKIFYELKYKKKYAQVYLNILNSLSEKCKDRLTNLVEVDFCMIKGVEDNTCTYPLTAYEVSKIPIREISWFYNDNTQFTMVAYSLNGKDIKKIKFSRTSDHLLLYRLQSQGYRFLALDDNYLKKLIAITLENSAKVLEESKKGLARTKEMLKIISLTNAMHRSLPESKEASITDQIVNQANQIGDKLDKLIRSQKVKAMRDTSLNIFRDFEQISFNEVIKETNLEFGRIHTN